LKGKIEADKVKAEIKGGLLMSPRRLQKQRSGRSDGLPRTKDPTSRRMLEGILAMEEHADDFVSLLEELVSAQ